MHPYGPNFRVKSKLPVDITNGFCQPMATRERSSIIKMLSPLC